MAIGGKLAKKTGITGIVSAVRRKKKMESNVLGRVEDIPAQQIQNTMPDKRFTPSGKIPQRSNKISFQDLAAIRSPSGEDVFIPKKKIKEGQEFKTREQVSAETIQAQQQQALSAIQEQGREAASKSTSQLSEVQPNVERGISPLTAGKIISGGLATGAVIGGGTAATGIGAPLAPFAAAAGFVIGSVGAVSIDKRQDKNEANQVRIETEQHINEIINKLNHDPNYSRQQARIDWEENMAAASQAKANINFLTNTTFKKSLSAGGKEKIKMDSFEWNLEHVLFDEFQAALIQPDPTKPFLQSLPENEK